ncbi:MAG: thioredoxin family protein [Bacteroidota bacterium]
MSIPTLHTTLDAPDRSADWDAAESFASFLGSAEDLVALWTSTYTRATVPDEIIERAEALPGEWKLLAMAADWCIDAAPVLPFVVRLAEALPTLEYRQLERDDHLELMDEHLTNGRSRSIPIVILLDGNGQERGWWGPRPAELQAWVMSDEAQAMENDERYKRARQWFARDKGRTTLHEILTLMESVAGGVA